MGTLTYVCQLACGKIGFDIHGFLKVTEPVDSVECLMYNHNKTFQGHYQ